MTAALERIDHAAAARTTAILATVDREQIATTLAEYRDLVAEFLADAAEGTVPGTVPSLSVSDADAAAVVDAIVTSVGFEIDDDLRYRVELYVAAGREGDALLALASELIERHARDAADDLAVDLGTARGRLFDVAAAIDERSTAGIHAIDGALDTAGAAVAWFRPLTAIAGALCAAAAAWGIVRLHRDDRRRAALLIAGALVTTGLAVLAVWWTITQRAAGPLDVATGTGADSWNLPAAVRALLSDVRAEVGTTWRRSIIWLAAVPAVAGLVLAGSIGAAALVARWRSVPERSTWLVAGASLAGVFAIGLVVIEPVAAGNESRACNGSAHLCERAYDDVVHAATHNSMSSPDVVQVWPEHDGDLREQLDAGIRALLIDTHYWTPVATPAQLQAVDPLLPPAVSTAVHAAGIDLTTGREGTFLCHNHCAFGSMAFVDGMVMVREFLDENPDEVVTLIIQDAITAEDTAAAMDAAGLTSFLYDHSADDEWPTLGELIDRGERLVVFAEQDGPPPPWYANAFEAMQETPFLAPTPEALSCRPNRGDPDTSLFLMNHWIQRVAPDRVDAANINRLDVIIDRARECESERGLRPNYIAVNFYNIGQVVEAVDVLNGAG